MSVQVYKKVRAAVAFFIAITVSIATTQNSYMLAVVGVLTGMLFLILVRSKTKIIIDEREKSIREKAAQMTYAIFAPVIGLGSFFLTMIGRIRDYAYLTSLGTVLAYLTLFLIALYSFSYFFLSMKFGGSDEE